VRRPVKPRQPEPRPKAVPPEEAPERWEDLQEELAEAEAILPPQKQRLGDEPEETLGETLTESATRHQRVRESRRASAELEARMAGQGNPRPPGHDTHHIVAHNDPRARTARKILEEAGINPRIDPRNGIHLPRTTMDPRVRPEAFTRHPTIHTDAYYRNLTRRLQKARREGTVVETLAKIREEIYLGQFVHPRKRG
jgi:hypothetical protein